ncbi:hypothetical protein [Pseudomonas sp. LS-2]|jgi:hypothetical protein|uniref:hypothetical protein n=1 Tax=Pseudomonas sp. LS-2 TaxID=2315859 RepID=UPI000E713DD7|nr:hypothetical protein [Pseudomonas sp. LS-2]RJX73252.1 hypothetical protein D3M70_29505 [Pseudomonas sp. LS-2]
MNNAFRHEHNRSVQLRILASFLSLTGVLAAVAVSILCGLWLIQDLQLQTRWPGYQDIVENLHLPASWWRWAVGDISEFAFYKHEFASIGLMAGAALAYFGARNGKAWAGFPICYGTGLWPWLVFSSLLGLLLSNLLWGWTLSQQGWQPTFVAFVSLPAAMVLLFGRGWRVALSGALLGALLVTPMALLIVNYVCNPLALPAVVGNVLGMALASIVAFQICRWFPALVQGRESDAKPASKTAPPAVPRYDTRWVLRRVLADFSEAPFFGNELASLGLLLGVAVAFVLNPHSPAYGSGLLPTLVGAQLLSAAIGVLIWRKQWINRGWYPTYIPLVSVVPAAILTHGDSLPVILLSAFLGALIAPPLATAIATRLPGYMHPYIANVLSMAISTLMIVPMAGGVNQLF